MARMANEFEAAAVDDAKGPSRTEGCEEVGPVVEGEEEQPATTEPTSTAARPTSKA
jgi:hypothetical protein